MMGLTAVRRAPSARWAVAVAGLVAMGAVAGGCGSDGPTAARVEHGGDGPVLTTGTGPGATPTITGSTIVVLCPSLEAFESGPPEWVEQNLGDRAGANPYMVIPPNDLERALAIIDRSPLMPDEVSPADFEVMSATTLTVSEPPIDHSSAVIDVNFRHPIDVSLELGYPDSPPGGESAPPTPVEADGWPVMRDADDDVAEASTTAQFYVDLLREEVRYVFAGTDPTYCPMAWPPR